MMWYYNASSEGIKFKLLTMLSAAEESEQLELTYTAVTATQMAKFPCKLHIHQPSDHPAIPFLGILGNLKLMFTHTHTYVYGGIIHNCQQLKITQNVF